MRCNVCKGTGFINIEQITDENCNVDDIDSVMDWMTRQTEPHEVAICHCCGDGEGWYGTPGEHYGSNDPIGKNGPYASNGGLCRCH